MLPIHFYVLFIGYFSVKKTENTAAAADVQPTLNYFTFLVDLWPQNSNWGVKLYRLSTLI